MWRRRLRPWLLVILLLIRRGLVRRLLKTRLGRRRRRRHGRRGSRATATVRLAGAAERVASLARPTMDLIGDLLCCGGLDSLLDTLVVEGLSSLLTDNLSPALGEIRPRTVCVAIRQHCARREIPQ